MKLPATLLPLFSCFLLAGSWARAAEVFEANGGRETELPGGKEADGIRGDFILRSDSVEAVISGNQPNRRANMSTFYGEDGISPGCLYDLTLRGAGNDQLVIYGPCGHGPVTHVRALEDQAAVESLTSAASNKGVLKRHLYRVEDGAAGVFITTTLKNTGAADARVPTRDDFTRFNVTGEIPAAGAAAPIRWADSINPAHRCGYALVVLKLEGADPIGGDITLAPGAEVTIQRFLAVGASPAAAVGEALRVLGIPVATVNGRLTGADDSAVTTASVQVPFAEGATLVPAYPDATGEFRFQAPAGPMQLAVRDLGRADASLSLTVPDQGTVSPSLKLPPPSRLRFEITDATGADIPCKAMFTGVNGTPNPNLGPRERAHGCVDQYHSETGKFTVQLPPGEYEVAVVRGPEFGRLAQTVKLEPETEFVFKGSLVRQVDSTGWISADFHNHSTPSGDNVCDTDGRVINLAAEHIEFAPTTEHNRLYDWEPYIKDLGLTPFLKTVRGIELTGRGQHINAFPFESIDPGAQDGGAPVWNSDPRITALTLRRWQSEVPSRWIQFNHPDLSNMFVDRNGDGIADGGFVGVGGMIDGTETQNFSDSAILYDAPFKISRAPGAVAAKAAPVREFLWRQLLNQGHKLVAVAVADAHTVYGNGVGGWRVYLPSDTDEPAEIDWEKISPHAKAGRIYLSSGPFLQVTPSTGGLPGDTVRATGGIDLSIRVQCADWLDIDHVQILVNSRKDPALSFSRDSHPDMFQDGVVKFDQTIRVDLQQDAHLIVVAEHRTLTLEKGFGTSDQARLRPVAYNNPIYVDIDGNGFQPNGDTLGFEIPAVITSTDAARAALERAGMAPN
jgi:hypothetical protein